MPTYTLIPATSLQLGDVWCSDPQCQFAWVAETGGRSTSYSGKPAAVRTPTTGEVYLIPASELRHWKQF